MDIDPANEKKSDQVRRSSEEQGLDQVRFYRCTFCKRGFSNAQALGGHMNIHRRDRAKLKEFSSDNNLLSLDIKASDDDQFPSLPVEYSGEEVLGSPSKRPCVTHDQESDDHSKEKTDDTMLPLFVEAPSSSSIDKEKGTLRDGATSALPELDLELRLGFEPPRTQ